MGIPIARVLRSRHARDVEGVDLERLGVRAVNARRIAVLSLPAALLLGSPVAGRGSASLFHHAVDSGGESEDVVPPRSDPDIFMTDPSAGAEKRDWMKFRTDACGQLLAIDSGRTTLRRTSFEDGDESGDGDGMDDIDGFDDGEPSDVGRTLIGAGFRSIPRSPSSVTGSTGAAMTVPSSTRTCHRTSRR